jgi:protein O-GlcNAc transferase
VLCDHADRTKAARLAEGVGTYQPFRLPYQGLADREPQATYGSLVCRIMGDTFAPAPMPEAPAAGERVRVGIVSGYFRDHSNWKIPIKGWLTQLDRRRFELFGYHTGAREDGETTVAKSLCRRFVRGPRPDAGWRQAILADAPHVLIYPEVGMDPVSVRLAAQRLAPVQCNSWGHPETSGFPTLDYFLSSELMEPADGEAHYTERLVRLPNLSIYCEPHPAAPVALGRRDLGLGTATAYWCGQSLFKYLPQYDFVWPRIARETGDCQFAFIESPNGTAVTEQFRRRLQRSFAALGLSAEKYCVILPRLDAAKFAAAAGLCDVVLDSIGWSGCNSTLEVLPNDLPVVTIGSAFMRGRHTMAILRMMGVSDTIAASLDDYVKIAVRLARDSAWRSTVRAKVRDNKHRVLRDRAAIAGLEDFLDAAARNALT